jgi:hypothetical protein
MPCLFFERLDDAMMPQGVASIAAGALQFVVPRMAQLQNSAYETEPVRQR